MHVFSTTTAHTHKTMSAFCTTRTKWNNACSPGKNEGLPLLELPTPAESAAHKPSSTCIATRITSKPTALWVRASPPTPPPSFDESHFLDSSSGWPSSPLPGNHPHQVLYRQYNNSNSPSAISTAPYWFSIVPPTKWTSVTLWKWHWSSFQRQMFTSRPRTPQFKDQLIQQPSTHTYCLSL